MTTALASSADSELRERAHDLRNLFGAIVSARHLLDDKPSEVRRCQILDALEEAAQRGGALTTSLLEASTERRRETFDLRARLTLLEPLLRTIAGSGTRLDLDLGMDAAPVRGVPDRFDHVLIEMVGNARAALASPGKILVRLRVRRGHVRVSVLDTGCGMAADACHSLLTRVPSPGAHGTGFQQVRRFVEDIHGTLRLRSSPGRGTLVAIEIPTLLCPKMPTA